MMLSDPDFLRAARTSGEARERIGDQAMMVRVEDWLRLVGMAEPTRQPPPTPGEGDVWAEVIATLETTGQARADVLDLMRERRQLGIDRYGVPLQRGNGRDAHRDLLEELLDAVAYSALCGRQYMTLVDFVAMLDADMRSPIYGAGG